MKFKYLLLVFLIISCDPDTDSIVSNDINLNKETLLPMPSEKIDSLRGMNGRKDIYLYDTLDLEIIKDYEITITLGNFYYSFVEIRKESQEIDNEWVVISDNTDSSFSKRTIVWKGKRGFEGGWGGSISYPPEVEDSTLTWHYQYYDKSERSVGWDKDIHETRVSIDKHNHKFNLIRLKNKIDTNLEIGRFTDHDRNKDEFYTLTEIPFEIIGYNNYNIYYTKITGSYLSDHIELFSYRYSDIWDYTGRVNEERKYYVENTLEFHDDSYIEIIIEPKI